MKRTYWISSALLLLVRAAAAADPGHNIILFVPDGLRSQIVTATTAPTLARLRRDGVDFQNSHSLFPTFTTANASAFATGHKLGDTGDFSNVIYAGFSVQAANGSATPFLESDPVLREMNEHFAGNYLTEQSIIAAAQAKGYSAALIGKLGPTAIFDVTALRGDGPLIIDDSTGTPGKEVPLPAPWKEVFARFRVSASAPPRSDNGNSGDATTPGTWIPNLAQQQYFVEVAIKAALPHFKEMRRPFVLIFWSRDPDGTQHNQGDSFHRLSPGINGPTAMSAIRNADTALAAIEQALKALDLFEATDIIVAADHGFSTITKVSSTSSSLKPGMPYSSKDVQAGELPPGFLAVDLFNALAGTDPTLKLFDPDNGNQELDWKAGKHLVRGNGLIGTESAKPRLIVAANGGSDLVYVPSQVGNRQAAKLARQVVSALLDEDYVSGIFVDTERFGDIAGTLSLKDIGLSNHAAPPLPAVVVNFASKTIEGCDLGPALCAAEIADTGLQSGQGMHGSFSRGDTWNFMAARGPDFRKQFVDPLPVSNADVGMTIAMLLGLDLEPKGDLHGRVLTEALGRDAENSVLPAIEKAVVSSKPDVKRHLKTLLKTQTIGSSVYLDAAGFQGRTVGLSDEQ